MNQIEKIKCECGSQIQKNSLMAHLKSHKHNTFIKNPVKIVIKQGEFILSFN